MSEDLRNGSPAFLLIGRANHDILKGTLGTVSIYKGADPASLIDTGSDITAIAVYGDVSAGQWVYVIKVGDDWAIMSW